jgi:hypothetical protein
MRTPFAWTLPSRASVRILCACCALWGAPAAALAASGQVTPTPVASAPAAPISAATGSTDRIGSALFDRRVLTLVAMACVVGLLAGWLGGGPGETRFRLLNKPKKTRVSVLVPPRLAPPLIPRDAPNATRASSARAQVTRQTPAGATLPRVIDYLAPFADPAEASEGAQVDYLLASDGVEEPVE